MTGRRSKAALVSRSWRVSGVSEADGSDVTIEVEGVDEAAARAASQGRGVRPFVVAGLSTKAEDEASAEADRDASRRARRRLWGRLGLVAAACAIGLGLMWAWSAWLSRAGEGEIGALLTGLAIVFGLVVVVALVMFVALPVILSSGRRRGNARLLLVVGVIVSLAMAVFFPPALLLLIPVWGAALIVGQWRSP
ncbi:MAG: hypothetical protein AAGI54_00660 [Planctomycetota bacterium]